VHSIVVAIEIFLWKYRVFQNTTPRTTPDESGTSNERPCCRFSVAAYDHVGNQCPKSDPSDFPIKIKEFEWPNRKEEYELIE
jgi:hypothetical protein